MTTQQILDNADAYRIHKAGKPVEVRDKMWSQPNRWVPCSNPAWDFDNFLYRPAVIPEPPKLVAWTLETYPADAKAFRKIGGTAIRPAIEIAATGVILNGLELHWQTLLNNWQYTSTDFSDSAWKPCGTLVV